MRQLQINTNTIYIPPFVTSQGLNSTIAEIGHELVHILIGKQGLTMSYHTGEYLAKLFQSQIWTALGDKAMHDKVFANANFMKDNFPDFNAGQASAFSLPSTPLPSCK